MTKRTPKAKWTGDIEKDLPHFALWVMAGFVVQDREIANYLAQKAVTIYKHNKNFGSKFLAGDNKERDLMIMFMKHWLDALLHSPCDTIVKEKLDPKLQQNVVAYKKAQAAS